MRFSFHVVFSRFSVLNILLRKSNLSWKIDQRKMYCRRKGNLSSVFQRRHCFTTAAVGDTEGSQKQLGKRKMTPRCRKTKSTLATYGVLTRQNVVQPTQRVENFILLCQVIDIERKVINYLYYAPIPNV